MNIERRVSLRQAAKLAGIDRKTLRRWLESDLGMVFPQVSLGSKILLRESDVEVALRMHSPAVDSKPSHRRRVA